MTDKLISMVDFVLELNEIPMHFPDEVSERLNQYVKYAKFLKTPLQLGHFVPCDEVGNVLEEPLHYKEWKSELKNGLEHEYDGLIMKRYEQSKSRCLFEGFKVQYTGTSLTTVANGKFGFDFYHNKSRIQFEFSDTTLTDINSIAFYDLGLTLTPYAKELIYKH